MQNLDQNTFNQWMSEFFNRKQNQLQYSNERQAKRTEKIVLDLSTAQTQPLKISVPFKTIVATKFYQTSDPTVRTDGQVNVLFDQNNLSAIKNSASLGIGDVLECETLINECFLTWDAQADTTVELNLYVDFSVRLGSVNTIISGSLAVSSSPATPRLTAQISAIDGLYTVSNRVAQVRVSLGGDSQVIINGNVVMLGCTANSASIIKGAGDLVTGVVSGEQLLRVTFSGGGTGSSPKNVFEQGSITSVSSMTQTFILAENDTIELVDGIHGRVMAHIEEYL